MGLFIGNDHIRASGANKRRYRRIALDRPAEIVVNSIDVYAGRLQNLSPGDAAVQCDAPVSIGDMATIYARDVDILPGRVVRHLPDGFALALMLSKSHRQKLIEKLFAQTNSDYLDAIDERRASPRHQKPDQPSLCRLHDGSTIFVKIIDVSVNGAAVDAKRKPAVGSAIRLAQRNGIVTRHTPRGFAISFDTVSFCAKGTTPDTGQPDGSVISKALLPRRG